MRCDLHVHTIHSGMCTVPVARNFCRESYNAPAAVYEKLKQRGMDLVTITDHDSIDAAESLRRHLTSSSAKRPPVTCRVAGKFTSASMTSPNGSTSKSSSGGTTSTLS